MPIKGGISKGSCAPEVGIWGGIFEGLFWERFDRVSTRLIEPQYLPVGDLGVRGGGGGGAAESRSVGRSESGPRSVGRSEESFWLSLIFLICARVVLRFETRAAPAGVGAGNFFIASLSFCFWV